MKIVKISVSLPDDLHRELKRQATLNDSTVSRLVRTGARMVLKGLATAKRGKGG